MASMTMTKARECPDCGNIHDCAFYVEMQVLTQKLDKKINEFVDYINQMDTDIVKEIPELEDK
tara:strand:- start:180 stop:368 length:189 start_codon:yes stop_codon:yes gene_type:complete